MHFIPCADSLMCPIKKGCWNHHSDNIKFHPLLQLEGHLGLYNAAILSSSQLTCMAGRCGQKADVVGHPHLEADQPSSKSIRGFKKSLMQLQTYELQTLTISSLRFIPHHFLCQSFSSSSQPSTSLDYRKHKIPIKCQPDLPETVTPPRDTSKQHNSSSSVPHMGSKCCWNKGRHAQAGNVPCQCIAPYEFR